MSYTPPDPKYFYLRGTIPDGGIVNIIAKDSYNIYHYLTYHKDKEIVIFEPKYKLEPPSTGDIINANPVLNCIIKYGQPPLHNFSISFIYDKKIKYLKPSQTTTLGKLVMYVDDKEFFFTYITTYDLNNIIAGDTHIILDTTSSANQIYWGSYHYTNTLLSKPNNTSFVDNSDESMPSYNILSVEFLPITVYEFSSGNIVSNYNPIVIDAKWVTSSLDTDYIKYASVEDSKSGNPYPRYCTLKQDCDLDNCYSIICKDENTICTFDNKKKLYFCGFDQKGDGIFGDRNALFVLITFLCVVIIVTFGSFGNKFEDKLLRGFIMTVILGFLIILYHFYSHS